MTIIDLDVDDQLVDDLDEPDVDDVTNHLLGCWCDECQPDRKHDT